MYSYVSLFSGAGGLDIGIDRCGFKAISLCEIESVFCKTLEKNSGWEHLDGHTYFNKASIINTDIREVSSENLTQGQKVDLVVGGPPCQAFSSSGKQLSILDPRGILISEFYRLIDEIKPKMFLFENVRGLVTARNSHGEPGGVISELLLVLQEIGYSCRSVLLNSADFGDYQRRVRCFILGTRKGEAPVYPSPTHSKKTSLFHKPWESLEGFLKLHADENEENYVYPTDTLERELRNLPNGSGLKSKGRVEATRPGGHWGYRQGTFIADLLLPARTVTGSASQDWIRWNDKLRRLTFNEIKLLQGFPSDWIVEGTKSQRFKQVGNAVPTVFGELLGNHICKFLDEYPKTNSVPLNIPKEFVNYIDYTKMDNAKNGESRIRHKNFRSENL